MFKKIISDSSWLFTGSMVYSISQWAITIIIAKYYSLSMLSDFSLALAICTPVFLFFNLNIKFFIVVDDNIPSLNSLIKFRGLTIALSVLFCFLFYTLLTGRWISSLLLFVLGYKLLDSFTELFYAFLQKRQSMSKISISQIKRGAVFILFLLFGTLFGIAFSIIIGFILFFLFLILIHDYFKVSDAPDNNYHLSYNNGLFFIKRLLPLGAIALTDTMAIQIPKYYLEGFGYSTEVGIFSSIILLIFIGGFIMSAVCNSLLPKLSNLYNYGKLGDFKRLTWFVIILAFSLGLSYFLVVLFFGEELLAFVYNDSFRVHFKAYLYLTGFSFIVYLGVAFSFILYSMGLSKSIFISNLFSLLLALLLGLFLVPEMGIIGSVFVFIISQFFRLLYFGYKFQFGLASVKR